MVSGTALGSGSVLEFGVDFGFEWFWISFWDLSFHSSKTKILGRNPKPLKPKINPKCKIPKPRSFGMGTCLVEWSVKSIWMISEWCHISHRSGMHPRFPWETRSSPTRDVPLPAWDAGASPICEICDTAAETSNYWLNSISFQFMKSSYDIKW